MSYQTTTKSPPPRCSSCYRPAPFHTKQCSYAAAASLHPDAPPPNPYQQAHFLSSISTSASDPPAYSPNQQAAAPNVVYEQRRRARGPIGYAVRWGVEKVREEHDKKKWKAQQVGTERVGGSSAGAQSMSGGQEGTGGSGSRAREFGLVQSEEVVGSRGDEKR